MSQINHFNNAQSQKKRAISYMLWSLITDLQKLVQLGIENIEQK